MALLSLCWELYSIILKGSWALVTRATTKVPRLICTLYVLIRLVFRTKPHDPPSEGITTYLRALGCTSGFH